MSRRWLLVQNGRPSERQDVADYRRRASLAWGWLARTMPRLPSRLSSIEVSSPQMYAPAPDRTDRRTRGPSRARRPSHVGVRTDRGVHGGDRVGVLGGCRHSRVGSDGVRRDDHAFDQVKGSPSINIRSANVPLSPSSARRDVLAVDSGLIRSSTYACRVPAPSRPRRPGDDLLDHLGGVIASALRWRTRRHAPGRPQRQGVDDADAATSRCWPFIHGRSSVSRGVGRSPPRTDPRRQGRRHPATGCTYPSRRRSRPRRAAPARACGCRCGRVSRRAAPRAAGDLVGADRPSRGVAWHRP